VNTITQARVGPPISIFQYTQVCRQYAIGDKRLQKEPQVKNRASWGIEPRGPSVR